MRDPGDRAARDRSSLPPDASIAGATAADRRGRRRERRRAVRERALSVAAGAVTLVLARGAAPPLAPAGPPPAARPTIVRTPVPVALPLPSPRPAPILLPTVVAAVPLAALPGCPPPAPDAAARAAGDGYGRAATAEELAAGLDNLAPVDDTPRAGVAASGRAPVLAILEGDGAAYASVDDGRRFARVLAAHRLASIAIDDAGTIAAVGDGQLGVRDVRGRERWTALGCAQAPCDARVVAIGDRLALVGGEAVRLSRDGGRTWRVALAGEDAAELARHASLVGRDGVLYGVTHLREDCGWDADDVASLDLATGAFRSESFNDDDADHRQLEVVDDAGAAWAYRPRVAMSSPRVRDVLVARLDPAPGRRALRVEDRALIEQCGARARTVAHVFGAPRVDAADSADRPLLGVAGALWRWSPHRGWRVLLDAPAPVAWPDEGGD